MILKTVIAMAVIFAAFSAWVLVQHAVRVFASRNPEWGPAREEGGECGISCGCQNRLHCLKNKMGQCDLNKGDRHETD